MSAWAYIVSGLVYYQVRVAKPENENDLYLPSYDCVYVDIDRPLNEHGEPPAQSNYAEDKRQQCASALNDVAIRFNIHVTCTIQNSTIVLLRCTTLIPIVVV